jgi:hypothetical protein
MFFSKKKIPKSITKRGTFLIQEVVFALGTIPVKQTLILAKVAVPFHELK